MKLKLGAVELELRRARPLEPAATGRADHDVYHRLPVWTFARERVRLLHGESLEQVLAREGESAARFDRVLVTGEGYRPASGEGSVLFAALEDLAANALRLGCAWVIDPRPLGFSGFTSRATSGFGVALGGMGFGFASPDGTFSEGLHLLATGLIPHQEAPADPQGG
jgi:hypothetical protein